MTPARLRLTTVVAGLVVAGLVLLAWTQTWFELVLDDGTRLSIPGQTAAPALSALGLASLALVGALSIAGPRIRIALGILETAMGALVVVVAVGALASPLVASAPAITAATAVSGPESIAALVASTSAGIWPVVAVVGGALTVAVGLGVLVTGRRWPGPTAKYDAPAGAETGTPVGAWDSLSDGSDPTR